MFSFNSEDPSDVTLTDEQQLKVLNAQIERARNRLYKLQKERDLVLYRIETGRELLAAHTVLPPIQRLTNEIIRSIFEFGSEAQRWRNHSLMLVCKRWYRLVVESPRLWNTIYLNAKRIEDFPLLSNYASACLARSGKLPLHLALESLTSVKARREPPMRSVCDGRSNTLSNACKDACARQDKKLSELALVSIINILRSCEDMHVHRWRSFDLYLDSSITISPLLRRVIDVPANNLVWVMLRGPSLPPPPYQNLLQYFGGVKKLYLSMTLDLSKTSLCDSQIQALSLSEAASKSFLTIASSGFLALTVLRLEMEMDPKDICRKIRLPALRHLTVNGSWNDGNMVRFETLKLTHLYVNCDYFEEEYHPIPLVLLAGRLTDLRWKRGCGFDAIEFLEALLRCAPGLQRIWGTWPIQETEVIEKLMKKVTTKARLVDELEKWPEPDYFGNDSKYCPKNLGNVPTYRSSREISCVSSFE